jgi:hypothetical protein
MYAHTYTRNANKQGLPASASGEEKMKAIEDKELTVRGFAALWFAGYTCI